jgi:hypothetical protein
MKIIIMMSDSEFQALRLAEVEPQLWAEADSASPSRPRRATAGDVHAPGVTREATRAGCHCNH